MAIVAVIMSVNFTACSDADDKPTTGTLVGQWTLTYEDVWEKFKNYPEEDYEHKGEPSDECCFFGHLTFKEDGTFTEYEMDNTVIGTGTWILRDNELILTHEGYGYDGTPETLKVIEFSSNKLVLEYYDKQDDGDEEYCKMTYQKK